MATYPATNTVQASELLVDVSNQMHEIVNEDAVTEVTTESGPVPSVRKALADTFLFVEPVAWDSGNNETAFNQLRTFGDETYWAPTATLTNPIAMGATPVGDNNWRLAPTGKNSSIVQGWDTAAQEELLPSGSKIYPEIGTLSNGDTVPEGTTHLRVLVGGEPTIVVMSPVASGVVSGLTETGATIGVSQVSFYSESRTPTVSDMKGLTWPINATITTRGYYSVGDKGGAVYINRGQGWPVTADELIDHSDASGNFLEMISEVTLRRAGAVGDNVAGDSDAVSAAFNRGGHVKDDGGYYRLDKTVNVQNTVHFEGANGSDAAADYKTRFYPDDGIVGVFFHRSDTTADDSGVPIYDGSNYGPGADGSVMEKFFMYGPGTGSGDVDNEKHGIWRKCRCEIRNAQITRMKGSGIWTVASGLSTDPYIRGNANVSGITNVRCVDNAGHGAFYSGPDANAGSTYKFNATGNGKWGMWEGSFLGNFHFGGHYDGNVLGPYTCQNANNQSVWIGTYVEPGQPNADLTIGRSLSIGGLQQSGIGDGVDGPYLGSNLGAFQQNSGQRIDNSGSIANIVTTMNGNPDNGDIFAAGNESNGDTNVWRLQWPNGTSSDLVFRYANLNTAYNITGPNTAIQAGTSSPIPYLWYANYVGIGTGNDLKRHTTRSAAPTSGEWARGDVIYYRNPSAAGKLGVVCTVAGTGGSTAVFKEFGAIDA